MRRSRLMPVLRQSGRMVNVRGGGITMLKNALIVPLALIVLMVGSTLAAAQDKQKKQYDAPPPMKIDPAKSYTATVETDKGKIVIDLFAKDAPKTDRKSVV